MYKKKKNPFSLPSIPFFHSFQRCVSLRMEPYLFNPKAVLGSFGNKFEVWLQKIFQRLLFQRGTHEWWEPLASPSSQWTSKPSINVRTWIVRAAMTCWAQWVGPELALPDFLPRTKSALFVLLDRGLWDSDSKAARTTHTASKWLDGNWTWILGTKINVSPFCLAVFQWVHPEMGHIM